MRSPALTVHIVGIAYGCVRMLIGAISVAYLMRAGLSLPQIGLLKSFQAAVIVFIDIPLSYFSDNYSRKFSIALSVLFSAIWLALTGMSEGFYGFLLAEFFNALSLGMMSGTFSAYLYDVSKSEGADHQAVTIFARYQKNQFFFMGIASLLGAGVFTLEPRLAWFMAALLMSVVLLITWFLPSDNFFKAPKDRAMMGRLKADMASMREVFRQNGQVGQAVILLALGYGLVLQSLIQYWQVLADIEHGNLPLGVLLGAVFFVVLMAQSLSGKVIESFHGTSWLKVISYLGLVATVLVMALSFVIPSLVVLYLVLAFFSCSLLSSLSGASIVKMAPPHLRSTFLSGFATVGKIIMFVTMPIIAGLIGSSGVWFFLIAFVLLVLTSGFLFGTAAEVQKESSL